MDNSNTVHHLGSGGNGGEPQENLPATPSHTTEIFSIPEKNTGTRGRHMDRIQLEVDRVQDTPTYHGAGEEVWLRGRAPYSVHIIYTYIADRMVNLTKTITCGFWKGYTLKTSECVESYNNFEWSYYIT